MIILFLALGLVSTASGQVTSLTGFPLPVMTFTPYEATNCAGSASLNPLPFYFQTMESQCIAWPMATNYSALGYPTSTSAALPTPTSAYYKVYNVSKTGGGYGQELHVTTPHTSQ